MCLTTSLITWVYNMNRLKLDHKTTFFYEFTPEFIKTNTPRMVWTTPVSLSLCFIDSDIAVKFKIPKWPRLPYVLSLWTSANGIILIVSSTITSGKPLLITCSSRITSSILSRVFECDTCPSYGKPLRGRLWSGWWVFFKIG